MSIIMKVSYMKSNNRLYMSKTWGYVANIKLQAKSLYVHDW